VYQKSFQQTPRQQALTLFDGFLPDGQHLVEIRLIAGLRKVPSPIRFLAASGMTVFLRPHASTLVSFEAENEGELENIEGATPKGSWKVDIDVSFSTEEKKE
jgi:hypothetical protein